MPSARGPDHTDVANSLNSLAGLYYVEGRYADAEPLYKRALAIREKVLGPDHPNVANLLNGLADLYLDEARYADAEPLYRRSLAIREKVLGPDHPNVAASLNNLANLYEEEGRSADAEPLYKRAFAIREKTLGPDHPDVAQTLNNLADLYRAEGRYPDAEPLYKRALAIREKVLGPDHPDVAVSLYSVANLYFAQSRYADAEPLYKRTLVIREKALGPDHPDVAQTLSTLAELYEEEGHYADAEPLYKRALVIFEKALGPDHPYVAQTLHLQAVLYEGEGRYADAEPLYMRALAIEEKAVGSDHHLLAWTLGHLADLHFRQRDWVRAAEFWRRSTSNIIHRAERGTDSVGRALTGKVKNETERSSSQFKGLVKAVNRLGSSGRGMFETAQWALSSEAAASLAQMAARGATGKPELAAIVRERQDLVAEWQRRDTARTAAVSQSPDKRNKDVEAANVARLDAIETRIAAIDNQFARDFPDYATLVSPKPLSVTDVQSELRDDEVLVLFLDTPEWKPIAEETFIWAVTKTDMRWAKSAIGTKGLRTRVAALRCGLDYDGSWGAPKSRCPELLKITYSEADYRTGKPLPFDINRSYELYQALFGQIEDLIKDKHILIAPSGALTSLPFQVLVTALPRDGPSGVTVREAAFLGAKLRNVTDDERKQLKLHDQRGVGIDWLIVGGPAETAGLKPNDILLSVGTRDVAGAQQATGAVRALAPHSIVQLRILREGTELGVPMTLGATIVRSWTPQFLDPTTRKVSWLIRAHALTVLPSVSSLRALRELAKNSHATRPLIGFGDPLLDGRPDEYPDEGALALRARANQNCPQTLSTQVASLQGEQRGVVPLNLRGGLASVDQIRSQVPLPETAAELCAVARELGAGEEDIWLGARATETEIKQLSDTGELGKYRTIHFATHGALAGQVLGDTEPGLLLTPPDRATEIDDGYLSASEVSALKIDADWVILSACNTAAGGAEGAQALSGLARAFFYAGARALLVSHWSVYSDAAVKLITGAIGTMVADKSVGRAEAMRQSMLALIDRGAPYESHPAVWAPFIVVGEGTNRPR